MRRMGLGRGRWGMGRGRWGLGLSLIRGMEEWDSYDHPPGGREKKESPAN